MIYEGEPEPVPSDASRKVLLVAQMLANGMGGFDWSALELAIAKYEVDNVEELIDGLMAVRAWHKPREGEPPMEEAA